MRESARKPGGGEREHTDLSAMTLASNSLQPFEWFCGLVSSRNTNEVLRKLYVSISLFIE